MKVIGIFKMKKIYLICLVFLTILLSGCGGNRVIPNDGEIVFFFPDEFRNYLLSEAPSYTFEFNGTINTIIDATSPNRKAFGKNDDFVLSDILSELFNDYHDKNRLTVRIIQEVEEFETKMNTLETNNDELKQVSHILKVDGNIVYNELAFIHLENGLILSFEYRRFNSIIDNELKTLYAWRYTAPLNAVLHYPLIVVKDHDQSLKLVIITIPPKSIYQIGISEKQSLHRILKDEKYTTEFYRSFTYPDHNEDPRYQDDFDLEKNIEMVKDYYQQYHQGRMIGEDFFFTYLNIEYKVIFKERSFVIEYLNPAF